MYGTAILAVPSLGPVGARGGYRFAVTPRVAMADSGSARNLSARGASAGEAAGAPASGAPAGFHRFAPVLPDVQAPPPPSKLLRADMLKEVVQDRDVHAHASLDDVPGSKLRRYTVYAAELVHADLAVTRGALTDYKVYPKMISYIDRADYSPVTRILDIEGGIWKFRLHSFILFEERSERWIHFQIIGGHFTGLRGDFLFEPMGEQGTLVYLRGEQTAERWPPKFVIERGAEIVFEYTAKRMRSYIESLKDQGMKPPGGGGANDQGIPQPRSHL